MTTNRLALALLATGLLAGCRTEVEVKGITGLDLREAYHECTGGYLNEHDPEVRLKCTAAVYGGTLK